MVIIRHWHQLLDQHTPLKTKKVVYEHYQPWYCSMIGDAIRNYRKLERILRADVNCKDKWAAFDKQRKLNSRYHQEKGERILPPVIYGESNKS